MNLGKFDLNESQNVTSGRRLSGHEDKTGNTNYYHDLPRLILLLFMMFAAIAGYYYKSCSNKPERVIARSAEKMLDYPFRASLEGSVRLKTIPLGIFKSRQSYSPQKGLTDLSDAGVTENNIPPFDALSALKALSYALDVVEYDMEDMYAHGTRHFAGAFKLPGDTESTVYAFEYWIDLRTRQAVRLIITKVERNAAINDRGEPVSKETYINIWYYE